LILPYHSHSDVSIEIASGHGSCKTGAKRTRFFSSSRNLAMKENTFRLARDTRSLSVSGKLAATGRAISSTRRFRMELGTSDQSSLPGSRYKPASHEDHCEMQSFCLKCSATKREKTTRFTSPDPIRRSS